jgi:hypothetical protein
MQSTVADLAWRQYPDLASTEEIPLLITLPAGIHPYNKAGGYYANATNTIVLYQRHGRAALKNDLDLMVVAHELAHWYQLRFLKEAGKSSVNFHRRKSWMEACYVATRNLWPELALEAWQFSPTKSVRSAGGGIGKIQRAGALTDTQLHAWPYSLTGFVGKPVHLSPSATWTIHNNSSSALQLIEANDRCESRGDHGGRIVKTTAEQMIKHAQHFRWTHQLSSGRGVSAEVLLSQNQEDGRTFLRVLGADHQNPAFPQRGKAGF